MLLAVVLIRPADDATSVNQLSGVIRMEVATRMSGRSLDQYLQAELNSDASGRRRLAVGQVITTQSNDGGQLTVQVSGRGKSPARIVVLVTFENIQSNQELSLALTFPEILKAEQEHDNVKRTTPLIYGPISVEVMGNAFSESFKERLSDDLWSEENDCLKINLSVGEMPETPRDLISTTP